MSRRIISISIILLLLAIEGKAQDGYFNYTTDLNGGYYTQGVSISGGISHLSRLGSLTESRGYKVTNNQILGEFSHISQYTWESNVFIQPEFNAQVYDTGLKMTRNNNALLAIKRCQADQIGISLASLVGKKIPISNKMRFILAGGPYISFLISSNLSYDYYSDYYDEDDDYNYEEYDSYSRISTRSDIAENEEFTDLIKGKKFSMGLSLKTGIEFGSCQLTLGYDHGLHNMYGGMPSIKNNNFKLTFVFFYLDN